MEILAEAITNGEGGSEDSGVVVSEDVVETKAVLGEIKDRGSDCAALVSALTHKIKSGEISTAQGMSFLEVKNNLMLQYLLGVSGLVLTKIRGRSIQESPYVDQLVELRTVLDKMRPIDQKIKYQVEKLIRNVADGKAGSDPLKHRANLDNLNEADSEESASEDEEDKPNTSTNKDIYRPPKVASLPYDDEEEAPEKQMEKVRKKSINRTLIRELQEQFLDTPLEIHNKGDAYAMELSRQAVDKQRYEETYMTRLPETKKDKHLARAVSTMGVLGDEITDFRGKRPSGSSKTKSKGTKRKKSGKGAKGSSKSKKFRKK